MGGSAVDVEALKGLLSECLRCSMRAECWD